MRLFICLSVVLAVALVVQGEVEEQQQKRILRRVIKSTPTATNLGRVRLVTIRSASSEKGGVAEISSKEAANFGQRSANETSSQVQNSSSKSKQQVPATTTTTTTQTPATSTAQNPTTLNSNTPSSTTTTSTEASSTTKPETTTQRQQGDNRQQSGNGSPEVELLSGAPSSWQTMTAVEAPAAMLIATGARASDLMPASSSNILSSEEATGDFLRSSATKGAASYTTSGQLQETFSRVQQQQQQQHNHQQSRTTQQQSFFYPQSRSVSKTASVKGGTKTHWYQAPVTTTTTPRPAPLIQEHYEQQNEQYVEQTPQIEYGAAPLGQAEPFAFDFKTLDNNGNGQYRKEESDKDGVVRGSYGYTDANGIYRHVEYVADQNGFRANIKSNEPGLNGETQPASIRLNAGQAPQPTNNQRLSAPSAAAAADNGDWISNNNNNLDQSGSPAADLALAPPNFESGHRSDRIRSPRQYRN